MASTTIPLLAPVVTSTTIPLTATVVVSTTIPLPAPVVTSTTSAAGNSCDVSDYSANSAEVNYSANTECRRQSMTIRLCQQHGRQMTAAGRSDWLNDHVITGHSWPNDHVITGHSWPNDHIITGHGWPNDIHYHRSRLAGHRN